MACNKPEHIKQESWEEHLRWLQLVSAETKTNQRKRQREKVRERGA